MKADFTLPCWMAPVSFAVLLAVTAAARADDASPWASDSHSAIRLIAGTTPPDGAAAPLRAGIELRVDSGWKTYWRYAGDSGLPPAFDFKDSQNVQSIRVLWPAPQRFPDGAGGHSIGYIGRVIFPVHVVPQDAAKPVVLRVKASYGVCEKVCIPAAGNVELPLVFGPSSEDAALTAAEARVPKPAALGAGESLAIRSVRRESGRGDAKGRVVIEAAAPEGANVDLFVEGPSQQWSLPLPAPIETAGTVRRFAFDIDGVPPGSSIGGSLLRLTLIADDQAIEVTTHLD